MQKANVPTFGDGNYRCLMTPEQISSLKGDTATGGWIDVADAASGVLLRGEAGTYAGVRILNVGSATGGITAGAGATYSGGTYAIHQAFLFGPRHTALRYGPRPAMPRGPTERGPARRRPGSTPGPPCTRG